MSAHMLELLLWVLVAFFLGGIIGCLLRQLLAPGKDIEVRGEPPRGAQSTGIPPRDAEAENAAAPAKRLSNEEMQGLMGAAPMGLPPASASEEAEAPGAREGESAGGARQDGEGKEAEKTAKEAATGSSTSPEDEKAGGKEAATATAGVATSGGSGARKAGAREEGAPAPTDEGDARAGGEAMPAHGLAAPMGGKADNLQMISGVGPKLEKVLHELGIYHFSQIAAWTEKDIAEVDERLKFKGRIERDEWVRQARLLAAGRLEDFEREYGTGGLKDRSGKTRAGTRTRKK